MPGDHCQNMAQQYVKLAFVDRVDLANNLTLFSPTELAIFEKEYYYKMPNLPEDMFFIFLKI
jgi:hypothetical protein